MASREEVCDFLSLFKTCLQFGLSQVKDRQKNWQGLIDLGMTPNERRDLLLQLVPEDYCAGPKPDDTDEREQVWEFGRKVGGTEVYIKLRVVQDRRRKAHRATVWSFHPAEHPMRYPLRGGGT
jgi:hypothetical protein